MRRQGRGSKRDGRRTCEGDDVVLACLVGEDASGNACLHSPALAGAQPTSVPQPMTLPTSAAPSTHAASARSRHALHGLRPCPLFLGQLSWLPWRRRSGMSDASWSSSRRPPRSMAATKWRRAAQEGSRGSSRRKIGRRGGGCDRRKSEKRRYGGGGGGARARSGWSTGGWRRPWDWGKGSRVPRPTGSPPRARRGLANILSHLRDV